MLARHPRHLKVLQRAAALGQWGSQLEPRDGMRRGRGVALHQSFGSIVAQVVEVSVDVAGALQVDRIVCVIDCGQAVNPNLIAQQVDSAIVYGLSAALHGDITLADGRVQQSNFHDYRVLKMAECPPVQTEIIASTEPPEGVGEPPLPPVAPALANAVFAATGTRLRSLPLRLS
jgi:isoquinoline 1-oxidoreductase beta subunit